jgi:hypothetical protein
LVESLWQADFGRPVLVGPPWLVQIRQPIFAVPVRPSNFNQTGLAQGTKLDRVHGRHVNHELQRMGNMRTIASYLGQIEEVGTPMRLALSLVVPAAALAAQVESAELLGVFALTDLLGVAFGAALFKARGKGAGNSVVPTE